MFRLEIIGGGRMGEALLTGMLNHNVINREDVVVAEVSEARRNELKALFPDVAVVADLVPAQSVILATKPSDAQQALAVVGSIGIGRVLSIAAGVRLSVLEACVGPDIPVIRAMPNTPALVGEGAAAISAGPSASEEDLRWAESILGGVGTVVRLPESSLDAVTGLSGSGPAYVFMLAEAMIEGGVLQGLSRDVAHELVCQTILGSARLLVNSSDGPESLRTAVTSPAGTTASGLLTLERGAFRATVIEAVSAATDRSRSMHDSRS
ncbi:MAG: pyrroline-5-carboxylate reductase [Microthrixaceae bacterium]